MPIERLWEGLTRGEMGGGRGSHEDTSDSEDDLSKKREFSPPTDDKMTILTDDVWCLMQNLT